MDEEERGATGSDGLCLGVGVELVEERRNGCFYCALRALPSWVIHVLTRGRSNQPASQGSGPTVLRMNSLLVSL